MFLELFPKNQIDETACCAGPVVVGKQKTSSCRSRRWLNTRVYYKSEESRNCKRLITCGVGLSIEVSPQLGGASYVMLASSISYKHARSLAD